MRTLLRSQIAISLGALAMALIADTTPRDRKIVAELESHLKSEQGSSFNTLSKATEAVRSIGPAGLALPPEVWSLGRQADFVDPILRVPGPGEGDMLMQGVKRAWEWKHSAAYGGIWSNVTLAWLPTNLLYGHHMWHKSDVRLLYVRDTGGVDLAMDAFVKQTNINPVPKTANANDQQADSFTGGPYLEISDGESSTVCIKAPAKYGESNVATVAIPNSTPPANANGTDAQNPDRGRVGGGESWKDTWVCIGADPSPVLQFHGGEQNPSVIDVRYPDGLVMQFGREADASKRPAGGAASEDWNPAPANAPLTADEGDDRNSINLQFLFSRNRYNLSRVIDVRQKATGYEWGICKSATDCPSDPATGNCTDANKCIQGFVAVEYTREGNRNHVRYVDPTGAAAAGGTVAYGDGTGAQYFYDEGLGRILNISYRKIIGDTVVKKNSSYWWRDVNLTTQDCHQGAGTSNVCENRNSMTACYQEICELKRFKPPQYNSDQGLSAHIPDRKLGFIRDADFGEKETNATLDAKVETHFLYDDPTNPTRNNYDSYRYECSGAKQNNVAAGAGFDDGADNRRTIEQCTYSQRQQHGKFLREVRVMERPMEKKVGRAGGGGAAPFADVWSYGYELANNGFTLIGVRHTRGDSAAGTVKMRTHLGVLVAVYDNRSQRYDIQYGGRVDRPEVTVYEPSGHFTKHVYRVTNGPCFPLTGGAGTDFCPLSWGANYVWPPSDQFSTKPSFLQMFPGLDSNPGMGQMYHLGEIITEKSNGEVTRRRFGQFSPWNVQLADPADMNAPGGVTVPYYGAWGYPIGAVDSYGNDTSLSYDSFGRLAGSWQAVYSIGANDTNQKGEACGEAISITRHPANAADPSMHDQINTIVTRGDVNEFPTRTSASAYSGEGILTGQATSVTTSIDQRTTPSQTVPVGTPPAQASTFTTQASAQPAGDAVTRLTFAGGTSATGAANGGGFAGGDALIHNNQRVQKVFTGAGWRHVQVSNDDGLTRGNLNREDSALPGMAVNPKDTDNYTVTATDSSYRLQGMNDEFLTCFGDSATWLDAAGTEYKWWGSQENDKRRWGRLVNDAAVARLGYGLTPLGDCVQGGACTDDKAVPIANAATQTVTVITGGAPATSTTTAFAGSDQIVQTETYTYNDNFDPKQVDTVTTMFGTTNTLKRNILYHNVDDLNVTAQAGGNPTAWSRTSASSNVPLGTTFEFNNQKVFGWYQKFGEDKYDDGYSIGSKPSLQDQQSGAREQGILVASGANFTGVAKSRVTKQPFWNPSMYQGCPTPNMDVAVLEAAILYAVTMVVLSTAMAATMAVGMSSALGAMFTLGVMLGSAIVAVAWALGAFFISGLICKHRWYMDTPQTQYLMSRPYPRNYDYYYEQCRSYALSGCWKAD